ncbi:MAG: hypothetical protein PHU97_01770 [Bacteroidales bacterium]|nr:hypothetical protein [Bacteroidales bacterium]MDD3010029.1 hypothetical protein [Bacteroidales bacterium]HPE86999.1 hypothetical protein [Bacteroidales bacterium]
MKKILISLIVVATLMMTACEEKILYLFPTFTNYVQFGIDQTTSDIYELDTLTREAINDSIGEIKANGLIEVIDIEGFYLNFHVYDDNEAQFVEVDAYLQDTLGNNLAVFENYSLDITALVEGQNYPLYDYLRDDGVLELRSVINTLANDMDVYDRVVVFITGTTEPAGVRTHMDIDMHFRINAKVKP